MAENGENGNNDRPPEMIRPIFSLQELEQEFRLHENKDVKSGVVDCKKAVIVIDNQEIDLLNLDIEKVSKLKFDNSLIEAVNENSDSIIHKSMTIQLDNVYCHFLKYLGQSITSQQLGNTYQAIPHKLIIYCENDLLKPHSSCEIPEELSNYLIVICPTDCQWGIIEFPRLKQKFFGHRDKVLTYLLFASDIPCGITAITKGLRVMIKYNIFHSPLVFQAKQLVETDTRKLQSLLRNTSETNLLIPITKRNMVRNVCDNVHVNCQQVYSAKECPRIVYSHLDRNDNERDVEIDFYSLIRRSKRFTVGKLIDFAKPQIINDVIVRNGPQGAGHLETNFEVDYYSFILINPHEDDLPEDDSPDPSEPDPSETDSSEPKTPESESSEPGTSEIDATEPVPSGADLSEPETRENDSSGSKMSETRSSTFAQWEIGSESESSNSEEYPIHIDYLNPNFVEALLYRKDQKGIDSSDSVPGESLESAIILEE